MYFIGCRSRLKAGLDDRLYRDEHGWRLCESLGALLTRLLMNTMADIYAS